MYPNLHLRVITPTEQLLDVAEVGAFACQMKGSGALEILPGHLPLIGVMEAGTIEFILGDDVKEMTLGEGILTVEKNVINLLIIGNGMESEKTTSELDEKNPHLLLKSYLGQLNSMKKEQE
jgi:F0F1-type ATP synthase epsilon subunit